MAADKIIPPRRMAGIVTRTGMPEQVFSNWCDDMTAKSNGLEGEGSPEGVVNAPRFWLYVNVLTDEVYLKRTKLGDASGWLLIS